MNPIATVATAPLIYEHVYNAFTQDAMTLLTLAGCWVTPFEDDEPVEDELTINAWHHIKDLFPDIALGLSWAVWEGCEDESIDEQLIREMNARVPGEYGDVDMIPYGPDFHFFGMDWHDDDVPKKYIPYGKLLDQLDHSGYRRDPYHGRTIEHLTDTLWIEQPGVSAFAMWLCGWTGNTLVDLTYDEYAENGYNDQFEWTHDDLDFAWGVQVEAETFMSLAYDGQKALNKTETYIQFCETLLKSNSQAIAEAHHVIPTLT